MDEFVRIASRSELPREGEAAEFSARGKAICVANVKGRFTAMDNNCAHRGGPLAYGAVHEGKVICPWHGWQFDTVTGKSLQNPELGVAVYELIIEGDDVLVKI